MSTDHGEPTRTQLDKYDTAILEFAEQWMPYAGGHEYVLAEFGVDVDEFYIRLQRIRQRLHPHERHPKVGTAVQRYDPVHRSRST